VKRIILALIIVLLPILGVATPIEATEIDGSDPRDPNLVYIEMRPHLDEVDIAGHGSPTTVQIAAGGGIFKGFSLPVWNAEGNQNEELYFTICPPDRWDGEHDPVVELIVALSAANEAGNTYQINLDWEKVTPNDEAVPATTQSVIAQRYTLSNTQYYCYRDWFVLDYDVDPADPISVEDDLSLRIRLGSIGGQYTDLKGELIILHIGVLFPRGDLLGEENDMVLIALVLLAVGLTVAMFATREKMLGFPCVIFWAVLGVYTYTQFTTAWVDWQFYLSFGSFGMVIFCALAGIGLREKRDTLADEEMDEDGGEEGEYIDEKEDPFESKDESEFSDRTKGIRERANRRRTTIR